MERASWSFSDNEAGRSKKIPLMDIFLTFCFSRPKDFKHSISFPE